MCAVSQLPQVMSSVGKIVFNLFNNFGMAYLVDADIFSPKIWRVELDTPAEGGDPIFTSDEFGNVIPVGGYDNIPAQLLANRTRNLHNRLLTLENQLLNQRLSTLESNGVGELVRMSFYPADLLSLTDYAFSGLLWFRGQAISRMTYSRLFNRVQHQLSVTGLFGPGDGTTTFTLADLRGEFERAWDGGRGVDTGRVFGSWQDSGTARPKTTTPQILDANGISHPPESYHPTGDYGNRSAGAVAGFARHAKSGETVSYVSKDATDSGYEMDIEAMVDGDPETRPRNRAFLWCVRY